MTSPPERIRWAVERLHVRPGARVLELGMGRGAAAELILGATPVTYVGIDRSATAVRVSSQRLEQYIRNGAATVVREDADRILPSRFPSFDLAFAVNVNLFWTTPAHAELQVLRRLLSPTSGRLHLVYEVPDVAQSRRIRELTERHLQEAGFTATVELHPHPPPDGHRLFGISAHVTDGVRLTSRS